MSEAQSRLLLDEMLSAAIAAHLRDRDLDAIAVVEEVSLLSTPDEDLLAYATDQHRALVTANIVDFATIANDWRAGRRTHYGIIYIAHRTFPQNRSFIGTVTNALAALCRSPAFPPPGTETFLTRPHR